MKIKRNIKRIISRLIVKYTVLYEMMGYIVGGGTAAVVDVVLLFFLTSVVGIWYWYSAAISFVCAGAVNYIINRKITFRNNYPNIKIQYIVFLMVAFSSLVWNQVIIYLCVEYVKLHYLFAKFISLGLVFFWSFFMHKYITYGILK